MTTIISFDQWRKGLWLIGFIGAALLTFLISDYGLFQLSRIICLAIAVLSLNLLTGHAGQISVGQGALFGLGAYSTVLLVYHLSVPYPIAVATGVVICFVVGLVIGLPALRLRGLNLAIVTLGAAVIFPALLRHYETLTGGVFGVGMSPPGPPGGDYLTVSQWLYLLSLIVLALSLIAITRLTNSFFGKGLNALRVNEDMALSIGVNIARSKIVVFGISSAVAGLGGGIYQLLIASATPDTFSLTLSLSLLFAAVIGGLRARLGAIVGAAFVVWVPDVTSSLGDRGPQLLYSIALLLAIYLLPGGIIPGIAALATRIRSKFKKPVESRSANDDVPTVQKSI